MLYKMRFVAKISLGCIASIIVFSLLWAEFIARYTSNVNGVSFPLVEGSLRLFCSTALPFLVAMLLLALLPVELKKSANNKLRFSSRRRAAIWFVVSEIVFVGISLAVQPSALLPAFFCGGIAAATGFAVYDRAGSFAVCASWICLIATLVLPVAYIITVKSGHLPRSNYVTNNILLSFVLLQGSAIFLGFVSFVGLGKDGISGVIFRSTMGITLGCLSGWFMYYGTIAVGFGR